MDVELERPDDRVVGRAQAEGPDVGPQVLDQGPDAVVVLQRAHHGADVKVPQRVPARLQDRVEEEVAGGEQGVHPEEGQLVLGVAPGQRPAGEVGVEQAVHHPLAEVRDAAEAHVRQQRPVPAQRDGDAEVRPGGQHGAEIGDPRADEIVVRAQPQGEAAPREIDVVECIQDALQVGTDEVGGQGDTLLLQGAREERVGREVVRLVDDARTDVHARPVQSGDEELLAVRHVGDVVLEAVVVGAELPAVAGQRRRDVEGREVVQVEGVVRGELEVLPDPRAEVDLGAGQAVRVQADAEQQRGAVHAVRAQAEPEGVDRRGSAVEDEPVRLLGAVQGIGHRLEGAGGLQAAHRRVDGRLVQRDVDVQPGHAGEAPRVGVGDAIVLDGAQPHGPPREVDGARGRGRPRVAAQLRLDGEEAVPLRRRGAGHLPGRRCAGHSAG